MNQNLKNLFNLLAPLSESIIMMGEKSREFIVAVQLAILILCVASSSYVKAEPNITGIWNLWPVAYPDLFSPDPPPPGGEPPFREPYKSQYQATLKRKADAEAAGTPLADPSTLCLVEGMPTIMGAHYALQILQSPGQITVLAEFMQQTRRIYLDEELPPIDELTLGYNGYSVAQWKGKVLEVKTIGIRDDVKFMHMPHSEEMTITERIYLTADNLLKNEITIEDPVVFTRPYKFTYGYKREDNDYKIMEYVCENSAIELAEDGTFTMKVEEQPKE